MARPEQVDGARPSVVDGLPQPAQGWVSAAAALAHEKGGSDIVVIDVTDRLALTDAFLLVTAGNPRQAGAIVEAIEEGLSRMSAAMGRCEGRSAGGWVLMDMGALIVHVMQAEQRAHYSLERLWKDCPMEELPPPPPDTSVRS